MTPEKIQRAIFVGDVHLDTRQPARQDAFCRFLEHIPELKPDHLFFLGDLFEFWFGYDTVMFSGYLQAVRKIWDLKDRGIPITYLTGNHDFCLGDVFENQIGLNVQHAPVRMAMGDQIVHISHGDQINSADWKYAIVRATLRHSLVQAAFRAVIPPALAWYLGRGTSDSSRKISSDRDRPIPAEVFDDFCRLEISRGTTTVVHGHNHNPGIRTWDSAEGSLQIIDSGSWLKDRGHYVEFSNNGFQVKEWPFSSHDC